MKSFISKSFILIPALLITVLSAQELTPEQLEKTESYNHKPSVQMKIKRNLQKIANISKEEAYTLAKSECLGEVLNSKLMRHNKRLFYAIAMDKCRIRVDALDGSVMCKEKK